MTGHLARRLHWFIFVVVWVCVATFPPGCSKKSDSTLRPAPAEAKAPPLPTTGTVEGRMVGQKSHKPLAGQLIVLCEIAKEPACNLRPKLKATTDADGTFVVKDVPPGRYTVTHMRFSDKADARLKEGTFIDPTARPVDVTGMVDIGLDGKLANIRGAVTHLKTGLTFEFEKGKLSIAEVRVGETTKVDSNAWGM
jgi:hypothetical protein